MNYIKRMFSWNGLANRCEFLGFWLISWVIGGVLFFLFLFITDLQQIERTVSQEFVAVCVLGIPMLAIQVCAAARRLRHIGWPTWLAFLFVASGSAPMVGILVPLLELALALIPAIPDKPADKPSYFKQNLLVFITVLCLAICPYLLLQAKHILARRAKTGTSTPRAAIHTSSKIPAEIMVPKNLEEPKPLARTKPMPMQLPAPKVHVVANRVEWQRPAQDCDSVCQQIFPENDRCKQYLSPDEKAHLCIHLWHKPGFPFEYHQILVDPQHQITEYIVFNNAKLPLWLGHFKNNQLTELFYGSSVTETYFFHLTKEGFVPDFTSSNHFPTAQHANVSIVLTDRQTWVPIDFDEQGHSSRSTSERELTTRWDGFNVPNQFVK